jgi:hypothetical protein
MRHGAAFRGQPLLLLAALLFGWMALRAALWQPPFEAAEAAMRLKATGGMAEAEMAASAKLPMVGAAPSIPAPHTAAPRLLSALAPTEAPWFEALPDLRETVGPVAEAPRRPATHKAPRSVVGPDLLLVARTATPGIPAAAPMPIPVPPRSTTTPSRWSADGWLLLREDTTSPILPGGSSYGRSQAGGVIRYRLAWTSPLQPQVYLRASTALSGAREREVAAGVAARLLPSMPLRFAVEVRTGETDRGTRLRPAAYAVTEFQPLELPLGMRGEAYAQAGYVGGDYATAFVDGQARLERRFGRGELELSAGVGVWGGAQKEAARLDIGPSAAVTFRLGGARGRLAADYRFRVAGDAEPSSGPALTLSAGF